MTPGIAALTDFAIGIIGSKMRLLAVFQFFELSMPGTLVAEGFGVVPDLRVIGIIIPGVVADVSVPQLKLIGFIFVFRVLDKKIQATTNGAFHFF